MIGLNLSKLDAAGLTRTARLLGSHQIDRLAHYPPMLAKAGVNIIDAWTGGAASEAMRDDLGLTDEIRRLDIRIDDLRKLRSALTSDLNRITSELESLRDPSEFMENTLAPALSALGFTVSKSLKETIMNRSNARDAEIKSAHEAYLSERQSKTDEVYRKQSDISQAESDYDKAQSLRDEIKSTNPTDQYFNGEYLKEKVRDIVTKGA